MWKKLNVREMNCFNIPGNEYNNDCLWYLPIVFCQGSICFSFISDITRVIIILVLKIGQSWGGDCSAAQVNWIKGQNCEGDHNEVLKIEQI